MNNFNKTKFFNYSEDPTNNFVGMGLEPTGWIYGVMNKRYKAYEFNELYLHGIRDTLLFRTATTSFVAHSE